MAREERFDSINGVLALLGVLFLVLLIANLMFFLGGGGSDRDLPPGSQRDHAFLLINDDKYVLSDVDDDGNVDCLKPTGFRALVGIGVYSVDDPSLRCSRGLDVRPLPPDLREFLSTLLARKYEVNGAHTTCLDLNNDDQVDCVLYVHNPDIVILEADGAQCPTEGRSTLSVDQQQAYSEIMALEESVRSHVFDGMADGN